MNRNSRMLAIFQAKHVQQKHASNMWAVQQTCQHANGRSQQTTAETKEAIDGGGEPKKPSTYN